MKTLVLAEKPSVGRDIARALRGRFAKEEGYLESKDYVITWAVGHLLTLQKPDFYNTAWKKWETATLPMLPTKLAYTPIDAKAKKQLKIICKMVAREDVDKIILATDPAREGELIGRNIINYCQTKKPIERLWISSMTDEAILDGMSKLKPLSDYDDLYEAAWARAAADWLVGLNATRAATITARGASGSRIVSLGRVQTPTLALLCARAQERDDFVVEKYWEVTGNFNLGFTGLWHNPKLEKRKTWIGSEKDASEIQKRCKNKEGTVSAYKARNYKENPPLLYDLTSLQREANRRYGYSAQRTLSAAQGLYEKHKLLTYPRTASRYLTQDQGRTLPSICKSLGALPPYQDFVKEIGTPNPGERIVQDKKVGDHHALLPTNVDPRNCQLDPVESKIYDLVARSVLAALLPAAEWQEVHLTTEIGEDAFLTHHKILVKAGWRQVLGQETKTAKAEIKVGTKTKCTDLTIEAKETKPPAYYTDATLLGAMETAGKKIDDEAVREALKESGLGTPATRANIIELLIDRGYAMRRGKEIMATASGRKIIQVLDDHPLTSARMTGDWEGKLHQVEEGKQNAASFIKDIHTFSEEVVKSILKTKIEAWRPERAEIGPCPRCARAGRESVIRENRKAYACSSYQSAEDPGCGFVIWKTVASRVLNPEEARVLLEEGETPVLSGFRSKKGKPFRAKLKLNSEEKVEMVFEERPAKASP